MIYYSQTLRLYHNICFERNILAMSNAKCLYIVVPCYNEEESIANTSSVLSNKLDSLIEQGIISANSRIVFVDDGSRDRTWKIISDLFGSSRYIIGLQLAHNRGHQNALLAGLMYSKTRCDYTISIDADLQQDVNAIEHFINEYNKGSEIVLGVRNSRDTDSFFKKTSASVFYRLMNFLGGNIETNAADYRLMSSKALDALSEYGEVNLFLRGIVPEIGLKSSIVHFDVFRRTQCTSKYSLSKMLTLALDGITSFSIRPIRIVFSMGIIALFICFAMIIHIFYEHYYGTTVSGWSSILASIWGLGAATLISLGVIGEYVGRNYMESKHRPRYYLSDILSHEGNDE